MPGNVNMGKESKQEVTSSRSTEKNPNEASPVAASANELDLGNLAKLSQHSNTHMVVQRRLLNLQKQQGNRFTQQYIQKSLQRAPVAEANTPVAEEAKSAPTGPTTAPVPTPQTIENSVVNEMAEPAPAGEVNEPAQGPQVALVNQANKPGEKTPDGANQALKNLENKYNQVKPVATLSPTQKTELHEAVTAALPQVPSLAAPAANQADQANSEAPQAADPAAVAASATATVVNPALQPALTNWQARLKTLEAKYEKYQGSEEPLSAEEKAALRIAIEAGEYQNTYPKKGQRVSGWGKLADKVWLMRALPKAVTDDQLTLYYRIQNSIISLTRIVLKIQYLSGKNDAFTDIKQKPDGTFMSTDKNRKYDANLAGGRGLEMVALAMEKLGMKYVDWSDTKGIAGFPSAHDMPQADEDENKKVSLVCSHFIGQVFQQAGGGDIFSNVTGEYEQHIRHPQNWTIVKGAKCTPMLDPTTHKPMSIEKIIEKKKGKKIVKKVEKKLVIEKMENVSAGADSIKAGDFGLSISGDKPLSLDTDNTLIGKFQHIVLFTGRTVKGEIEYIHAPDVGTGVQLSYLAPKNTDKFEVIMRPTQAAFDKSALGEKKSRGKATK